MRILFFAHLKRVVGHSEIELACNGLDAEALWSKLIEMHPSLARFRGVARFAKNSEYVRPEARFYDADEVALIPPVAGG